MICNLTIIKLYSIKIKDILFILHTNNLAVHGLEYTPTARV